MLETFNGDCFSSLLIELAKDSSWTIFSSSVLLSSEKAKFVFGASNRVFVCVSHTLFFFIFKGLRLPFCKKAFHIYLQYFYLKFQFLQFLQVHCREVFVEFRFCLFKSLFKRHLVKTISISCFSVKCIYPLKMTTQSNTTSMATFWPKNCCDCVYFTVPFMILTM